MKFGWPLVFSPAIGTTYAMASVASGGDLEPSLGFGVLATIGAAAVIAALDGKNILPSSPNRASSVSRDPEPFREEWFSEKEKQRLQSYHERYNNEPREDLKKIMKSLYDNVRSMIEMDARKRHEMEGTLLRGGRVYLMPGRPFAGEKFHYYRRATPAECVSGRAISDRDVASFLLVRERER